jgi:hypothetical protein
MVSLVNASRRMQIRQKNVDCPQKFAQGGPHIEAQHANVAMGEYMQAG